MEYGATIFYQEASGGQQYGATTFYQFLTATGFLLEGVKGSVGTTTQVNGLTPIGGLSSSILGISTNPWQDAGSALFEDQAADHTGAVIGGVIDGAGGTPNPDINVSALDVTTFEPDGNTNKHIRYETASSGDVAPDAAFPNTYLNKTDPPDTVEPDGSTFSQEP